MIINYRRLDDLIDPEVPQDGPVIDEIGEPGLGPWVAPLAAVLIVLAVGLTGWNVTRLTQRPPEPPAPTPVEAKQALYLGVMRVEAFRRVRGVTPETMKDAGLVEGIGYTYRRLDPARYVLSFQARGASQEYDSVVPQHLFFGSAQEMLSMGARGGSP